VPLNFGTKSFKSLTLGNEVRCGSAPPPGLRAKGVLWFTTNPFNIKLGGTAERREMLC
jgi:hypothetical protein